jgi:hypothetical protein
MKVRLSSSQPGYLDRAGFVQKSGTIARPRPVLRSFDETSGDRVTVHVLQLFNPLVVSEDIEVVVAGLPEGPRIRKSDREGSRKAFLKATERQRVIDGTKKC